VDGWLHGFAVEVVDGAGRAVPRAAIHHVNVIVPTRRELFSDIMLRIAAVGAETAPVRLPRLLGHRVHAGDSVLVIAMLHNPTATPHTGVRCGCACRSRRPGRS
jgi:hypothetical protein